jgi:ankyrin repeat protein
MHIAVLTGIALLLASFSITPEIKTPAAFEQNSFDRKYEDTASLFSTIRNGSEKDLETLLQNGADANTIKDGFSALMAAALYGTPAKMKLLIDHGAKVNFQGDDGITALWLAVPDWNKSILLLDHGADPQLMSSEGFTVLSKLGNIPGTATLLQLLIDKGADPKKSGVGNFLLYNAASSCDTAVLGLLIRYGLSVNDTARSGDYPLNAALNYRCFPTVKMLVDYGADVNISPTISPSDEINGITPLMFASLSADSLSFYYLLEHGANPKLKSKIDYTALMFLQLAERDLPEMTLALIELGASVSEKGRDGSDALSLALKKGNSRSAEIIRNHLKN